MENLLEYWESYKKEVIPKDVNEAKIANSRLIFYSGAIAAAKVIGLIVGDDDGWSDKEYTVRTAKLAIDLGDFLTELESAFIKTANPTKMN